MRKHDFPDPTAMKHSLPRCSTPSGTSRLQVLAVIDSFSASLPRAEGSRMNSRRRRILRTSRAPRLGDRPQRRTDEHPVQDLSGRIRRRSSFAAPRTGSARRQFRHGDEKPRHEAALAVNSAQYSASLGRLLPRPSFLELLSTLVFQSVPPKCPVLHRNSEKSAR